MFLKQLAGKKLVTIDYDNNGCLQTIKGHVYRLNLKEQMLSLQDERKNFLTLRLSWIRKVR